MKSRIIAALTMLASGLISANANTIVAGYSFQDNAFADSVISSAGFYNYVGAGSLSAAVTGPSLSKYAFRAMPTVAEAYIQLGFTDNYLVNGAGNDLALFEFGTPSTFSVKIGNTMLNYLSTSTGFTSMINGISYPINVALINLDAFGVAAGTDLSSIWVGMGVGSSVPSLSVVGALNSAPLTRSVPDAGSTASMLGAAFIGLGLLKGRR